MKVCSSTELFEAKNSWSDIFTRSCSSDDELFLCSHLIFKPLETLFTLLTSQWFYFDNIDITRRQPCYLHPHSSLDYPVLCLSIDLGLWGEKETLEYRFLIFSVYHRLWQELCGILVFFVFQCFQRCSQDTNQSRKWAHTVIQSWFTRTFWTWNCNQRPYVKYSTWHSTRSQWTGDQGRSSSETGSSFWSWKDTRTLLPCRSICHSNGDQGIS